MIIIYHVNFAFAFFILVFIIFNNNAWRIDWKEKEKKIETTTTAITTTTTITKKKRSSKLHILNVYVLINTALFIYNNEKTFIIMTKIWNLIWRCMKVSQNSYYYVYNNRFRNFKIIIRICETHLHDVNIIK